MPRYKIYKSERIDISKMSDKELLKHYKKQSEKHFIIRFKGVHTGKTYYYRRGLVYAMSSPKNATKFDYWTDAFEEQLWIEKNKWQFDDMGKPEILVTY